MSDETKVEGEPEDVLEGVAPAETEAETNAPAIFFDVFDAVPAVPEPVAPEVPAAEPFVEPKVTDDGFHYKGRHVYFNESDECFISKDGECLGIAAGVIEDAEAAKKFVDENPEGE